MAAGLGRVNGSDGFVTLAMFKGVVPLLNLRPYQQVLSDRHAVAFSLAGFVARLPMSMTGIGIVLLVSLTTGSFAWPDCSPPRLRWRPLSLLRSGDAQLTAWARLGSCYSRS